LKVVVNSRTCGSWFSQEYGFDHEETFAPVAKMTSIRTLIVVVAACKWPLFKMEVKVSMSIYTKN